jgi:hypothetical protein
VDTPLISICKASVEDKSIVTQQRGGLLVVLLSHSIAPSRARPPGGAASPHLEKAYHVAELLFARKQGFRRSRLGGSDTFMLVLEAGLFQNLGPRFRGDERGGNS